MLCGGGCRGDLWGDGGGLFCVFVFFFFFAAAAAVVVHVYVVMVVAFAYSWSLESRINDDGHRRDGLPRNRCRALLPDGSVHV